MSSVTPVEPRPVVAIVPAAGSGERLGAGVPKAMALLAGEPILAHAVRALVAERRVGLVVLAAPEGLEDAMAEVAAGHSRGVPVVAVTGGATRAESVALALAVVPEGFDVALVHDAARCLVPGDVVAAVVDAVLAGADAVVPGAPVVDTIRELDADGGSRTIDRSRLRAVQTPQGFSTASPAPRARGRRPGGHRRRRDGRGAGPARGARARPSACVQGDDRAGPAARRGDPRRGGLAGEGER